MVRLIIICLFLVGCEHSVKISGSVEGNGFIEIEQEPDVRCETYSLDNGNLGWVLTVDEIKSDGAATRLEEPLFWPDYTLLDCEQSIIETNIIRDYSIYSCNDQEVDLLSLEVCFALAFEDQ